MKWILLLDDDAQAGHVREWKKRIGPDAYNSDEQIIADARLLPLSDDFSDECEIASDPRNVVCSKGTAGCSGHDPPEKHRVAMLARIAQLQAAGMTLRIELDAVRERLATHDRGTDARCEDFDKGQDAIKELARLAKHMHSWCRHPDYEYETTTGPRKGGFDEDPPEGEGWERNVDEGDKGWERFEYHEEAYWRRLKAKEESTDGA